MFDDLDDEWALMPPSPPPLPDDFGGNNAPSIPFLFNFGQFDQKMHKSQDLKDFDSALAPGSARSCYGGRKGSPSFVPPRSSDSGSQHKDHSPRGSGLNVLPASDPRPPEDVHPSEIDPSAFCFNPQEDGDLLHLVFGMADEMPTMATTHLHMRPGEDVESEGREEEEEVELAFVNRRSIDKSKPEHYLSLPLSSEASFGLGKGSGMDRGEPLPSLPIVSAPAISAPMDVEAPAVNMSWTGALSGAKYLS